MQPFFDRNRERSTMTSKYDIVSGNLRVQGDLIFPPVCLKTGEILKNEAIKSKSIGKKTISWVFVILSFLNPLLAYLYWAIVSKNDCRVVATYYLSKSTIFKMDVARLFSIFFLISVIILTAQNDIFYYYTYWGIVSSLFFGYYLGTCRFHLVEIASTYQDISGISPKVMESIMLWQRMKKNLNQIHRERELIKHRVNQKEEISPQIEQKIIEKNLSDRSLHQIPQNVFANTHLATLNLSQNKITHITSQISELTHLKTLDISNNPLKQFPEPLRFLIQLQQLHLSNCRLRELPDLWDRFAKLQQLHLTSNRLKTIPDSFEKLKSLEILDFSSNQLSTFPDFTFPSLKYCNFHNNRLRSISNNINEWENLTFLDLSFNQISNVPSNLGLLKKLNHLSLKNNKLTHIPQCIELLTHLKTLDISGNQIKDISFVEKLPSLEKLIARNNDISTFNYQCKNITILDLSENKIEQVVCSCENIKNLILSKNKIEHITLDVENLKSLSVLDLSYNKLEELDFGKCDQLKSLNIANNKIKEIPTQISLLSNLKELDASNNNIKNIPKELGLLSTAKIDFSQNENIEIPFILLGQKKKLGLIYDQKQAKPAHIKSPFYLQKINKQYAALILGEQLYTEKDLSSLEGKVCIWENNQITILPQNIEETFWSVNKHKVGIVHQRQFFFVKEKHCWTSFKTFNTYNYLHIINKQSDSYSCLITDEENIFFMKAIHKKISMSQDFSDVLEKNVHIAKAISHNGFAQTYNIASFENYIAVLQEWANGKTLYEKLQDQGTMLVPEAIFYFTQILCTLRYYSSSYKYITTRNIMIHQSCIKMLNLATQEACLPHEMQHMSVNFNQEFFVYTFLSPEVLLDKETDQRSIIFSLGCVLYYMLSLKFPFKGKGWEKFTSILEDPATPLALEKEEPIGDIIGRMLSKSPSDRYQSIEDLLISVQKEYPSHFLKNYCLKEQYCKGLFQETFVAFDMSKFKNILLSIFSNQICIKKQQAICSELNFSTFIENDHLYISSPYIENILICDYIKEKVISHRQTVGFALNMIKMLQNLHTKNIYIIANDHMFCVDEHDHLHINIPILLEQVSEDKHTDKLLLSVEEGCHLLTKDEIHYRIPTEIMNSQYDEKAQIYSIGIFLYYALTNSYPYLKSDLLKFQCNYDKRCRITEIKVSAKLSMFIEKTLDYTQEAFRSLEEMKQQLQTIYNDIISL